MLFIYSILKIIILKLKNIILVSSLDEVEEQEVLINFCIYLLFINQSQWQKVVLVFINLNVFDNFFGDILEQFDEEVYRNVIDQWLQNNECFLLEQVWNIKIMRLIKRRWYFFGSS